MVPRRSSAPNGLGSVNSTKALILGYNLAFCVLDLLA